MIKPKRKKPWAGVFEKVRILFVPRVVWVEPEEVGPDGRKFYVLRYGPKPEHVVRKYPTIAQAIESGRKLAAKFGAKLMIIARNGETITNPSPNEMMYVKARPMALIQGPGTAAARIGGHVQMKAPNEIN